MSKQTKLNDAVIPLMPIWAAYITIRGLYDAPEKEADARRTP